MLARPTHRTAEVLLCASLAAVAVAAAPAEAVTTAALAPSLSPDRPGAKGALTLTIHFASDGPGEPSPVRRAVLRFPAGLGVEIPHLRSCSVVRLRAHGPQACPPQSQLGRGSALAEAQAGSQLIDERIALWLFLGPFHNLQPSLEILGQGYTPFDERVVLSGTVVPDNPPYGEDLALTVPPVPTIPLEPDASIVTMSLTVGVAKSRDPRNANTVVVPRHCPPGGFDFAAQFTYADGSTDSPQATLPCPG